MTSVTEANKQCKQLLLNKPSGKPFLTLLAKMSDGLALGANQ